MWCSHPINSNVEPCPVRLPQSFVQSLFDGPSVVLQWKRIPKPKPQSLEVWSKLLQFEFVFSFASRTGGQVPLLRRPHPIGIERSTSGKKARSMRCHYNSTFQTSEVEELSIKFSASSTFFQLSGKVTASKLQDSRIETMEDPKL